MYKRLPSCAGPRPYTQSVSQRKRTFSRDNFYLDLIIQTARKDHVSCIAKTNGRDLIFILERFYCIFGSAIPELYTAVVTSRHNHFGSSSCDLAAIDNQCMALPPSDPFSCVGIPDTHCPIRRACKDLATVLSAFGDFH